MSKNFNGVDLSRHNGDVDFSQLRGEVDFVILRSSVGVPSVNSSLYGTDTKFRAYADGCVKNGIPFGVYHYSTAQNTAQAQEEARLVLTSVSGFKLAYPIFIDVEDEKSQGALGKDAVSDIIIAFADIIEKAGYLAGIYANKNWLENKMNYSRLKKYEVWIAQWGDKVTWTAGQYQLWQYTSDGVVSGVGGRVDKNICYKDYLSSASEPDPEPSEARSQSTYTVESGDTLYAIAQKFGLTLNEVKKANPQIADYNLIHSGDIINIPQRSDETPVVNPSPDYSPGARLELNDVGLYSSAGGERANTVTGVYYLYDGKEINGYYRITNSPDRVGKEPIGGNVTGYIEKSDIK